MTGAVLGIGADFHDASVCVVADGKVIAAAEEERFTRVKHEPGLPRLATRWALEAAGLRPGDISKVVIASKPFSVYERIIANHSTAGPAGIGALTRSLGVWNRSKLWIGPRVEKMLASLGHRGVTIEFGEHHESHAASAFLPSPFGRAAILTFDGVGEWTTSSIGVGEGDRVRLLREQRYPDSLGLFYTAMTVQAGFAANSGEYKLMGLAPFGEPRHVDALLDEAIRIHDDGSVTLSDRWFGHRHGRRMGSRRLDSLLGPPLQRGREVGEREADLAASAQAIVERAVLAAADHARKIVDTDALCLAGGVALNCVANGRLLAEGPFADVWVQPAAGDAGGAVGAALLAWHRDNPGNRPAEVDSDVERIDGMGGCALGPSFESGEVDRWLDDAGVAHRRIEGPPLHDLVAESLDAGAVIGWFDGAMEFGPRALGRRSILGDPRDRTAVGRINQRIKQREGFRPFAPAVLAERLTEWFDCERAGPHMSFTVPVKSFEPGDGAGTFADRLGAVRSPIPACTHVDGSARVQVVDAVRAPELHSLISAFDRRTGCPVVLNTSFNGPDEPIVCSPADALRSARRIGLDLLVLQGNVIEASELGGPR